MPSQVLIDVRAFVAGYDLSGQMNACALEYGADMRDATTFGAGTRINAGGLKTVVAKLEGLWDASTTSAPDPVAFNNLGIADQPAVISPTSTVGDPAFLFRSVQSEYTPGAAVGDLYEFSVSLESASGQPLVRGALLAIGAATGDTTGAAVLLGAVSATQSLYAALEVMSGTGNFTAKIQSDDNPGFTSPTDRITFTLVGTAVPVASEWKTLAGPITDTYYRLVTTNPNTRNFTAALGIK